MFIVGIETFTVNSSTAQLILNSPLDYEHTTSYLLTLRITDTGKLEEPSGNITIRVNRKFLDFCNITFELETKVISLFNNYSTITLRLLFNNPLNFRTVFTAAEANNYFTLIA